MLKVLEISQISPPRGSVRETSLPLTLFDIFWLKTGSTNRVFFYNFPHPTSHFIYNILPNFKSSLSSTLQHFFPLAGKIRLSPGTEEQYELHYEDGDSVTLTVVEHINCNDFDELSKSHPRDINRLLSLHPPEFPQSNETWPVCALQVTLFPGHGIAVGVTVHHGACDGASYMQFVSSWASACKGSEFAFEKPAVCDRTTISDPQGVLYKTSLAVVRAMVSSENRTVKPVTSESQVVVSRSFTLTSQQIEKLKERLNCSTAVATFAYAWVCLLKARRFPSEKIAYMGFVVESRSLLKPPLPSTYFGNCVVHCLVGGIRAADLVEDDDGLVTAAKAISKAIKETKEDVLKAEESFFDNIHKVDNLFTIAPSTRSGVYQVDFGWGRPVKVEMTSIANSGAMAIATSGDDEGGVEVSFVMPKDEMDDFATHFDNGLGLL